MSFWCAVVYPLHRGQFLLEIKGYVASLFIVLMGSMDCLTTIVGTLYFGTLELNPLVAGLLASNLPGFVILKLGVSFLVGGIFVLAEKALYSSDNKVDRSFHIAKNTLKAAYIGIALFLALVVTNNVLVLLRTLFV